MNQNNYQAIGSLPICVFGKYTIDICDFHNRPRVKGTNLCQIGLEKINKAEGFYVREPQPASS